jgi:hypothetical protein
MRTAARAHVVTDPDTNGDGQVLAGMLGDLPDQKGIVAVAVERDDGTCVLFCRGSGVTWPSRDEAKKAVEKSSPDIVWRESTQGVWVARCDVNVPPVLDRVSGRRRRTDPDRVTSTSTGRDTYMAARVLRGTARFGQSRSVPHGTGVDSGVSGERQAG